MKKLILVVSIIMSTLFLLSCSPNTSKYAGVFELESYQSDYSDDEIGFKLITSYRIELNSKSIAKESYQLGVMKDVESTESVFTIVEEENIIKFRYVIDMFNSFTQIWEYNGTQIIMKDVDVAVVDNPDYENENHYVKAKITLKRVI